ncbi:hypothetical protein IU421_14640 [Nocardia cyriacigeorgica]|uniref:hypothetical protein n=1 Tax=Nocardia cyriacigeorgica TaxID=135487 RepID=UPI00189357C3|nr:hypothetical protein [Nocardia cyriacigeorgica]MBF6515508.1 hypothetical protein [Nocardia cyriacigeorgica]
MTTPHLPTPPGDAFVIGDGQQFGSRLDQASIQAIATGGVKVKFGEVQGAVGSQLRTPISNAYTIAVSAQGSADVAVTTAQAAANEAAAAGEKADIAYENAHYWSVECVVASAEVLLGVNELLLGPVLNVPDGLDARLTDAHFAFITQPGGCTIEIKRWEESGTVADVIHTQILGANVTRYNANALDIPVFDKERFFYNVISVVGSVAPTVLQVNVSGVYIPQP